MSESGERRRTELEQYAGSIVDVTVAYPPVDSRRSGPAAINPPGGGAALKPVSQLSNAKRERRPRILTGLPDVSSRAVDRNLQSRTDGAHPGVGEAAKPIDQHRDRDTFDRVQIHRGTTRDRVGTGFKNNLAGQPPNGCGAGRDDRASKPGDRRIARENNDWTPTDLSHLTPPQLSVCRKSAHESAAARRHDARSPHSSGSSTGCLS
ncbi:hypothetical protein MSAR_30530 [Mycolicibacterium sarraceniae]|uniref:Uncharacterized protein n=1 Tax=Mycolicibacterium sarraceniae TaxID=1534348 RepID=A0A7I7SSD4_9MYCO|nr:hypothetical protein MSAR_30530 [Mycolicibacterium sarraceniae]